MSANEAIVYIETVYQDIEPVRKIKQQLYYVAKLHTISNQVMLVRGSGEEVISTYG